MNYVQNRLRFRAEPVGCVQRTYVNITCLSVRFTHPTFMSRNVKKTARMPAMKFPKLQKRLRMIGTGKASGTRGKIASEKGQARNRKRFY